MEIKEFIDKLNESNLALSVEDNRLVLQGVTNKLTEEAIGSVRNNNEVIDYIRNHKEALIAYIRDNATSTDKRSRNISAICRLSGLQEGLLFHGLYDKGVGSYNMQVGGDLIDVKVDLFLKSWDCLIQRHSILRSGFHYNEFQVPVQCMYRNVELPVTRLDLRGMDEQMRRRALSEYEEADRIKPFDFSVAPLMRITLVQISEDRCRWLWTHHHLILDGWSMQVLIGELIEVYEQLVSGQEPETGPEDRYEDFIRYIEKIDKDAQKDHWKKYLQGLTSGSLLPFTDNYSKRNKGEGVYREEELLFDITLTEKINAYAKRNRTTVNTVMQAAWSYLLHRYTGNRNIVFGVTVSGRPDMLPGIEKRVGMYINTLPLHTKLDDRQEVSEWLKNIQQGQWDCRSFQHSTFNDIQQWAGIKGELFDSILVFENFPVNRTMTTRKWQLRVENLKKQERGNYLLGITVVVTDCITIKFNYKSDLISPAYMTRMKGHFQSVIQSMIAREGIRVGELEILTPLERNELLDRPVVTMADENVLSLFEKQTITNAEQAAVIAPGQQLSYKQLHERSNQLAHYLLAKGVKKGSLVSMLMERSPAMIVGILGILKAGAAYVPIDPAYPEERIAYILEDTHAQLLLTDSSSHERIPKGAQPFIIDIDDHMFMAGSVTTATSAISLHANDLAYVLYTSGSTGRPKGVMIEHGSLLNYVQNRHTSYINDDNNKAGSYFHLSYSFDASLTALWMPLLSGKSIILASNTGWDKIFATDDFMSHAPFDFIKLTPGHMELLKDVFTATGLPAKRLVIGGEALHSKHLDYLYDAGIDVKIINEYGPTEATVGCMTYRFSTASGRQYGAIPIGKPIDNTAIILLNEDGKLVPAGVTGEIYIGGAGVARGYLNQPELTAEKFLPDNFSGRKDSRLYRTGDLARRLPDGNLEYIGRIDDQVKIRGYRIEPGEIEQVLRQHNLVKEAAVVAREGKDGNKRLIGYVVIAGEFDKEEMLAFLKSRLPEYMVPSLLLPLPAMPYTSNTKIDRHALPDPDAVVVDEYVAPANALETTIALTWTKLLDLEQVSVTSDFFELGGHSLLATRLVSALQKALETEVSIGDIFDYPTVRKLSAALSLRSRKVMLPRIVKSERPGFIPLSFSQERLWIIDRLEGSIAYHIPATVTLHGRLHIDAFEQALAAVVHRHEVLRTVIVEQDGVAGQQLLAGEEWRLVKTERAEGWEPNTLEDYIRAAINRPFNLSTDYLFRAELISLKEDEYILIMTLHHIAADGWSMPVLVGEIKELYSAFIHNRKPSLKTLAVQYADYAIWQRQYLQGAALDQQLAYWKKQLKAVVPLDLPTDYPRPAILSTRGAFIRYNINQPVTQGLQQLSQQEGTTLFMTLLAAFKTLLHRYTGEKDICVGSPIAGRTQEEVEALIGFFVNTIVLRSQLEGEQSFRNLVRTIRDTALTAYDHQLAPFEKVVEAVVTERDMSRRPLFQVMFIMQSRGAVNREKEMLEGIVMTQGRNPASSSKFDISFSVTEAADGLQLYIEYSTDLYKPQTIERMAKHYECLLQSITANPDEQISKLAIFTQEEQFTLAAYNGAVVDYPRSSTIVDLFNTQVVQRPGAVALTYEQHEMTYGELDQRSGQLANYLISRGVGPETLVPMVIAPGIDMIVGILGILKAGGAYVPIDPDYPLERINYILGDCKAGVVITHSSCMAVLPAEQAYTYIALDSKWPAIAHFSGLSAQAAVHPNNLAYIIYTSGSTGRPKGVMVEHRNVVRLFETEASIYDFTVRDVWTLFHSYCFDFSVWELFGALLYGGRLVIVPKSLTKDLMLFGQLLIDQQVTVLNQTPSAFYVLQEYMMDRMQQLALRYVIFGGEALNPSKLKSWKQRNEACRLINMYGITETTVHVTYQEIGLLQMESEKSLIGRPIPTLYTYILDTYGNAVPVGVAGELYVSGAGVARGYLNQPALTAERFIDDPFNKQEAMRMYRTGDLARWLPDGSIEYLGRIDNQVKIRGYRIEPNEVERVLNNCVWVKQAVIVAKVMPAGGKGLIAYLIPEGEYKKEAITVYLQSRLPEYMLPQIMIEIAQVPLTPNGKVDVNALPEADTEQLLKHQYIAPRNEIEAGLAGIWKKALQIDKVGILDNFFELGGHSLVAIHVIAAIKKEMNADLPLKKLFQLGNILMIAAFIQFNTATDQDLTEEYETISI